MVVVIMIVKVFTLAKLIHWKLKTPFNNKLWHYEKDTVYCYLYFIVLGLHKLLDYVCC